MQIGIQTQLNPNATESKRNYNRIVGENDHRAEFTCHGGLRQHSICDGTSSFNKTIDER